MKSKTPALLTALIAPLVLTQCAVVDENGNIPGTYGTPSTPQYGQPLTVSTAGDAVTIREGARVVSSFRTAMPNVEETRWASEQEQIVVKSRANHGPATVQLFNSRNGAEQGRVMAYDIRGDQPAWAAGMGE